MAAPGRSATLDQVDKTFVPEALSPGTKDPRELGIRVALGARTKDVLATAVGRPVILLGVGSVVGLLLSTLAGWLLEQIVYQANPRDPVVLVGAVLTMGLLGVAASAIPALRAIAIDPSKLLREE